MMLQAIWTREAWKQMELETQLRNRLAQAMPNLKDEAPTKLGVPELSGPTDGPGDRG